MARADAVAFARDLVNEPGGSLTPDRFATLVVDRAEQAGVDVEVWEHDRLVAERMGGLLAVNQGSHHPARLVILRYQPDGASGQVALVGKGITFDSGGLSLKTAAGMEKMKIDMAGAAAVAAAMCALPSTGCSVGVTAYLCLTDNMTGPDAIRPGDVFTARNGTTVEVLNTDAEGRLVLADGLSLAAESDPDAIIDFATLTGAATVALGAQYAAVFATNDELYQQIADNAEQAGELVWRLPLVDAYRTQLDSTVADIKNVGAKPQGGAILAAMFLQTFVGDVPWVHVDVGLSVFADAEDGPRQVGATGGMTATLISLLGNWTP